MASLTQNEDAVRAMPLPDDVTCRLDAPRLDGARARMNASVVRALNIAAAQELDRGTAPADILTAGEMACAVAIAGLAFGIRGDGLDARRFLATRMVHLILDTLEKLEAGEARFQSVDAIRGGHT